MTSKALVVLSGGQDSATCAYWAKTQFDEVHAVTFDYGQRHRIEIDAAEKISALAGIVNWEVVEVGNILAGTSPLVSDAPLEQYANHGVLPGGLEKTFVPARNLLFLTLAANRAYVAGINQIVTGVCQEDYGGYPDCRDGFIDAVAGALNEGLFTNEPDTLPACTIWTPLMYKTKRDTVLMMTRLGIDAYKALAFTHTAYDGRAVPDGHDHASLLRAKGFEEAHWPDPLVVRAVLNRQMPLPQSANYDVVTLFADLDTTLTTIYGRLISA